MNRSKIRRYGPWALAPPIGAAAMLAFLILHDRGGGTFDPPAAMGEQGLPGTPVAVEKIQEARDFKNYPLWWLGESFDSLALAGITRMAPETGSPTMNITYFVYGDCKIPPGQQSCGPPLSIATEPLCFAPPEKFVGLQRDDTFDFRGAKALWVGDSQLRIWSGDSAISIYGRKDRVLKAADAIQPLGNVAVALVDSNLPPPNFDSCPAIPIYPTEPPIPTPLPTPLTPYPY